MKTLLAAITALLIVGALVYPSDIIWVEGMGAMPRVITRTRVVTKKASEYDEDWLPKSSLVPCICPHSKCGIHPKLPVTAGNDSYVTSTADTKAFSNFVATPP